MRLGIGPDDSHTALQIEVPATIGGQDLKRLADKVGNILENGRQVLITRLLDILPVPNARGRGEDVRAKDGHGDVLDDNLHLC